MPITSITSDPSTSSLTVIGDFPVSRERLWDAWSDPRLLERFWGPPQWPATFTQHEVTVGARSLYFMTGPEGQLSHGYWDFLKVDAPTGFEVHDGFANPDGTAKDEMPGCTMVMRFEETSGGSRFVGVTTFPSVEAMESMLSMGMLEGLKSALAQMDDVLSDLADYSASMKAQLTVIDDTHACVERVVRGSIDQVWRAHHEAPLLQQWMLGPDGWTMPVCEVATEVGETYRYEWESTAEGTRFGFAGEVLESEPPRRQVSTEAPIGMEVTPNVNELLLIPQPGGRTLIRTTITFATKAVRDIVLGTPMLEGMERSYARLETVLS